MSLHLHHVTAADADRDRRRTPLDLTNDEIEQQRQRSIVLSARRWTSTAIRPADERFWEKIDGNGVCWEYDGAKDTWGHGRFSPERGVFVYAHRYAYESLIGPIPDGMVLDHLCRNPACVNPDHLEPVTQAENIKRGYSISAVYARRTHCKNGHEFTADNTLTYTPGARTCKQCKNAADARYRARKGGRAR